MGGRQSVVCCSAGTVGFADRGRRPSLKECREQAGRDSAQLQVQAPGAADGHPHPEQPGRAVVPAQLCLASGLQLLRDL